MDPHKWIVGLIPVYLTDTGKLAWPGTEVWRCKELVPPPFGLPSDHRDLRWRYYANDPGPHA